MTVQIEVQSDKLRDLIHKWETEKPQVAKPIDLSRLRSEIDKPPVWHDTRGIPRVITWTLKVLGYPKEQYYKKNHYEIVTMLSKDLSLRTAQIELWWLINESSKPGQKEVKRDYSDFKKGFSYSIPVFPQNSCDYIRRFAQILDYYRYEDWEYSLQQHSKFFTDATSAQDLTSSRKTLMKTYYSTISAIAQDNNIDLVRYYEDIKELSLVLAARGSYLCNFANKQPIMDKAENITYYR